MTIHEYRTKQKLIKAQKFIDKHFDKLADSFLHKEAKAIDRVYNYGLGKGFSHKIPHASGKKASVYKHIQAGAREAKAKNKVERVPTKEVLRDRETFNDYLLKTSEANARMFRTLGSQAKYQ